MVELRSCSSTQPIDCEAILSCKGYVTSEQEQIAHSLLDRTDTADKKELCDYILQIAQLQLSLPLSPMRIYPEEGSL